MENSNPTIEETFQSAAEKVLATLKKTITHARKDPEDPGLWQRLQALMDQLQSDAAQSNVQLVATLTACMKPVPVGVREGRFRLTLTHLNYLVLICEYLTAFVKDKIKASLIPVALLQSLAEKIYGNETFSLKGLSLSETLKKQNDESASTTENENKSADERISISLGGLEKITKSLDTVIVQQFQLKKNLDLILTVEDELRALVLGLKQKGQHSSTEVDSGLLQLAETTTKDLLHLDGSFKEDLAALDRNAFVLQEEVAKLRMMPFGGLVQRLEKEVDSTAKLAGVQALLSIKGSETLLDKVILERIAAPLLELIHNAVAHGLEPAARRTALGKPEFGLITVDCSSDGNTLTVEVSDDGQGVEYEAIRQVSSQLFPLEAADIDTLTPEQLGRFLFQPGVTTVTEANKVVSGNGKGLELVKRTLDDMQGKVSVHHLTSGSKFSLQFPSSESLISGFFIRSAGERFFVSSVFVREIVIFPRSDLVSSPMGDGYRLRDMLVPVLPLSSIFEGKETTRQAFEQMVVVDMLGEMCGLVVDTVVRYASLSFKALPDTLAGLKEIQGVVYDEKFNLVPILHIPAVMGHLKRVRSIEFRDRYSPKRLEFCNILVVDDSPVSRQTVMRILQGAKYQVEGASDGIEALDLLHKRFFHLIITDDAMPRMDGCTLIENLRKETGYAKTPVIGLLSTQEGESHQQFKAAGINEFFNKDHFDRLALLEKVHSLLELQA